LWAPWRLPYIVAAKDAPPEPKGCFLCRYVGQPEQDAANFVVCRGTHTVVTLNRFPYNNGHLLVAPLAHKATLEELSDEELLECMTVVRRMTVIIARELNADGFNVGLNLGQAAGAGLPGHLHWHVVPRWNGDTSFMPVLADVNVIPQSLQALHDVLTNAAD
jgi:ATP adenylyltransferase